MKFRKPTVVGDVDINLGNTLEQCLYAEECAEDHILCPKFLFESATHRPHGVEPRSLAGGEGTYSLPLVEVAFITELKDQVIRDSPSSPFWVVDIVFESISLIVELGDVELLQGMALDGPDTISTNILS